MPTSKRYGKEFTPSQVTISVGQAIFKAMQITHRGDLAAVALPDLPAFREKVATVAGPAATLGIAVLWVGEDGPVAVENAAAIGDAD